MQDSFGRRFHYLRLSLTEVCNFRCVYCLPRGAQKRGAEELSVAEIATIAEAFALAGLRKVRLSGGEPTLRKDLVDIVRVVRPHAATVALSSNGYRLEELADALADAGLDAVNVSVDSLDAASFARITGKDMLASVLRGIERCLARGLRVKLNAVLMRDENENGLDAFVRYAEAHPVCVRFIQLMRTQDNETVFLRRHMPVEGLLRALASRGFLEQARAFDAGPAREFVHPRSGARIGVIAPYSPGFCETCNRLRVTSTGRLQLCLFGDETVDLRETLPLGPRAIIARIEQALTTKPFAHRLAEGNPGATRHLAMVGG